MDEIDLEEHIQISLLKIIGEYGITDDDIENITAEIISEIRIFVDAEIEARIGRQDVV